jgi:hypothetical protein
MYFKVKEVYRIAETTFGKYVYTFVLFFFNESVGSSGLCCPEERNVESKYGLGCGVFQSAIESATTAE